MAKYEEIEQLKLVEMRRIADALVQLAGKSLTGVGEKPASAIESPGKATDLDTETASKRAKGKEEKEDFGFSGPLGRLDSTINTLSSGAGVASFAANAGMQTWNAFSAGAPGLFESQIKDFTGEWTRAGMTGAIETYARAGKPIPEDIRKGLIAQQRRVSEVRKQEYQALQAETNPLVKFANENILPLQMQFHSMMMEIIHTILGHLNLGGTK